MRIAISCDENPGDSGSVAANGTPERVVNVRVATALESVLRRCGVDAWFDSSITYVERVARANSDGSSVLVACAHNESTPGFSGTQFVFCPGGQSFGKQSAAAAAVYAELDKLTVAGPSGTLTWPKRLSDAVENIYECCNFDGDTVYIEYLAMSVDDQPWWSRSDYPSLVTEATARALAVVYGFTYVPVVPVKPPTEQIMTDEILAAVATKQQYFYLKSPTDTTIPDWRHEMWIGGPSSDTSFNVCAQDVDTTVQVDVYALDGTPIHGETLTCVGNKPDVKGPVQVWRTLSDYPGVTGPCTLYIGVTGPGGVVVAIH